MSEYREPWRISDEYEITEVYAGRDGIDCAEIGCFYAGENREDNPEIEVGRRYGRRAIDCVNALAGIPNPAAVRELIEAARVAAYGHRVSDLMRLRKALEDLDGYRGPKEEA